MMEYNLETIIEEIFNEQSTDSIEILALRPPRHPERIVENVKKYGDQFGDNNGNCDCDDCNDCCDCDCCDGDCCDCCECLSC